MRKIDFLRGNAFKNLASFFFPLMFAFYFSMAFDITDSLWIGNLLGEKALAAQTVSMPFILLYNSICMGATGGVGILLAQAVGAKNQGKVDKLGATSFVGLLVFSVLVTIACEAGLDTLLTIVNTPPEIYSMAEGFLRIHILSFPFCMLYMYFDAVLRSYGNSVMQLATIVVCTILNVILDPALIPVMGLNGVALATVVSEFAVLLLLIAYCGKTKIFRIHFRCYSNLLHHEILAKAIPAAFQQSIPAISTAFITSLVASFGLTPIAGFGTAGRMETLLLYPPMAMNIALTSMTGQCFGAGNIERAKEYTKWGTLLGCGILAALILAVTLLSKDIAGLFGNGDAARQVVAAYFAVIAVGYVCNSVTNGMLGTINGAGKPVAGLCLMIFYYLAVRMPLAKIFAMTPLGLNGIWIAVLVSHIAAAAASSVYCAKLLRKKIAGAKSTPANS